MSGIPLLDFISKYLAFVDEDRRRVLDTFDPKR
jgi:hypothetical protein